MTDLRSTTVTERERGQRAETLKGLRKIALLDDTPQKRTGEGDDISRRR